MKTEKKLGIWMDHFNAYLIEFNGENGDEKGKALEIVREDTVHDPNKGENLIHSKEQHQQAEYYKKLGKAIKNYTEVILFGPTDAKVELLHVLEADRQFENIKIETQTADKMSVNQQDAFVAEYFSAHVSHSQA